MSSAFFAFLPTANHIAQNVVVAFAQGRQFEAMESGRARQGKDQILASKEKPRAGWRSTSDEGQEFVGRPDRARGAPTTGGHFFSSAVQFSTTDMGAASACLTGVMIRNLCPSRLTS